MCYEAHVFTTTTVFLYHFVEKTLKASFQNQIDLISKLFPKRFVKIFQGSIWN